MEMWKLRIVVDGDVEENAGRLYGGKGKIR